MIDIYHEELISLHTACGEDVFRNQRTGKPANIASIYRYALRGGRALDGSQIRLETIKTPSGLRTSKEAIQRFIDAMSNPPTTPQRSVSRAQEIARAESELRKDKFEIGGPSSSEIEGADVR
jgi:hypothetical protein